MEFQEFSKNYLNNLMELLSQQFFLLSASGVFPVIFTFNWNDSVFAIFSYGSSLGYCHKRPDVF